MEAAHQGRVKLGGLDFAMAHAGQDPAARLREVLDTAVLLDDLGFTRLWLSEHHTDDAAHGAPEMLVAPVLERTRTLRCGPAGILLRFYSGLKVAKNFRVLEALYPGRVDLGLARGGASPETVAALLDGAPVPTEASYDVRARDVVAFLRGEAPRKNVPVTPRVDAAPDVWVLGTGFGSVPLASRLGAAYSVGLFIAGDQPDLPKALAQYRERFRPSPALPQPLCNVAVAGVCAEKEDVDRLLAEWKNPFIKPIVNGTPAQCRAQLESIAARYGVDEIVYAPLARTVRDRHKAYELLAAEMRRPGPALVAGEAPLVR